MKYSICIQKVLLSLSLLVITSFTFLLLGKVNVFAVNNFNSSVNTPSSYVNIGKPGGIVMLPDGNIWYMDILNSRLVKYNPSGNTILRTVGRGGYGEGEFGDGFRDMTRDGEGNLYVVSGNSVVMKFDSNGGFIQSWNMSRGAGEYLSWAYGITYDPSSNAIFITSTHPTNCTVYKFTTNMGYLGQFGTQGSGDGDFNCPNSVATDTAGNIYVTDGGNARVQVFDSEFNFKFKITTWNGGVNGFWNPDGITVLTDGTIVVVSRNTQQVVEFDSAGNYLRTFGGIGTYDGNMNWPEFVIKDQYNNIYVSDENLNSITKFDSEGNFLSVLRNASFDECKIYGALDVAYDSDGNKYILDLDANGASRVQKWNADGTCAGEVIPGGLSGSSYAFYIDSSDRMFVTGDYNVRVFEYNPAIGHERWEQTHIFGDTVEEELHSDPGHFNQARGIAESSFTGHVGHIYVSDMGNHRIEEFDENLDYVNQFATGWTGANEDPVLPGEVRNPEGLVVASNGDVIVADETTVQRFGADGSYIGVVGIVGSTFEGGAEAAFALGGSYWSPIDVAIDSANNIYVGDKQWQRITEYDSDGDYVNRFGTYGSGQGQYNEPGGIGIDSVTGNLSVSDNGNSRVETYSAGKVRILNLISSANVISLDSGVTNNQSISDLAWSTDNFTNPTIIPARLMFGDYVVADFTINLTVDRNWSAVNVQTLPWDSKSLVINMTETDPITLGISSTHSLYLTRYSNQTSVTVCPGATTWEGVYVGCPSQAVLVDGALDNVYPLSSVTINTKNYWKIDDLTGTGAFSTLFETGFALSDIMTRQQVDIASNHELSFGTTYDINHIGDTITIGFSKDWDIAGDLTVGDLSLYDWTNATNLPLSDTAADDTWTVGFVTSDPNQNKIVFTAPQNADESEQVIPAGSVIKLFINDEALINPSATDSYMITLRLLTDSTNTLETGSVNVSIVDSDQVNVTGFVNAFMSFDIDTGVLSDSECASNGCVLHGGTSATADNYTVDLGELKSIYVNKSNGDAVMHSDGISGVINSIYLDLSTNAQSGAIVTVSSANEGLKNQDDNMIASLGISTGSDGDNITSNTGLYGFNVPILETSKRAGGTIVPNAACHDVETYCGPTASTKQVFNTSSSPIDTARVRMDLAAAATYTNTPGSYTDTLTFVATAEF